MAALNFPNSPSTNDLHTENGLTFKWNGTIWKKVGPAYTDTTNLNVTGIGTIAGNFHVGGVLTYEDVKNVDSVGIITARTGLSVTAGDVVIPDSIIHSGDTNTKIRFPAADTITAETGGSERLRIDDSGNVLVGTTDTSIWNNGDSASEGIVLRGGDVIDIARKGDLQLNLNRQTNDGPHIGFYRSGSQKSIISTRSNAFCIDVNGSERLRIDSSGRMLYGKTSSTLETSLVLVGNSNSYATNPGVLQLEMGNTPSNLGSLGVISFGSQDKIGARIDGRADQDWNINSAHGTHIRFLTTANGSASNPTERLRIDSAGNIGINIIPNTQGNTTDSIQLGTATNLYNESSDDYTILANNAYYDGTNNKYIKTQESSRLMQAAGNLWFQQAASGSADATITYTTPLLINSLGIIKQTNAGNTQDGTYYSSITIDNTGSNTWSRLRLDRGGVARWGLSLRNDDKFAISNLYTNGSVANPDDDCFVVHNNSKITMSGFFEASDGTNAGHGAKLGNLSVGYDNLYNTIQTLSTTNLHLQYNHSGDIQCNEGGGDMITADVRPRTNNAFNLGTNSYRWANIHTNDLNLSNEGNVNDVDGTWGKYTIQEGENDLYLINRRNGKKYKFLLKEVD